MPSRSATVAPNKKSTSVDANDLPDFLSRAIGHETVNGGAKEDAVAEDGRDVLEQDSRLRKIRHVAHGSAQSIGLFHQLPKEISAARAVSTICPSGSTRRRRFTACEMGTSIVR